MATPLGALFGSSLSDYVVWAARGFADPIAYFFLFVGVLLVVPKREDVDRPRAWPAFCGALALAAATFCRPNLVLVSGAMVAGAAVLALRERRILRMVALVCGFAVLGLSPLHNYVFGHSLLPFSNNVYDPRTMVTTPRDYLQAIQELVRLDIGGEHVLAVLRQQVRWLSGSLSLGAMVRSTPPRLRLWCGLACSVGASSPGFACWLWRRCSSMASGSSMSMPPGTTWECGC